MHILLIPDSFKDSIAATEIVQQLKQGFSELDDQITTESCIASDGGEGFLDFVKKYVAVTLIPVETVDPLGREMVAEYAFAKAHTTAFIELAKASGLELLAASERNPLLTSTYGTGLQLKDAIKRGATEIYIGLGGSATNDAGTGMASALGYEFLDKNSNKLIPNGGNLIDIVHINSPASLELPTIYAINDVDNVLTGTTGAAHIYGKQKGASVETIIALDKGLSLLANVVSSSLKSNERNTPGSGAAGGSGYGLKTFCNASFIPGVRFLAQVSGIEKQLKEGNIDLIITGEGSIDHQTLRGKLVKGVSDLGKKYKIPVMAICGVNQLENSALLEKLGLKKVFAIADLALSKEDSFNNAATYIKQLSQLIYDGYTKDAY